MLGSIRKRTGSLLVKGLLGLLVVAFALWGVGDIFQAPRDQAVAEVGGAGIHASLLQAEYTATVENLRRTLGLDAEQARSLGALDSALDRLIDREVVNREAMAIGIGAPDDTVLRAIENNPVFHDVSGRFDKAVYSAILYRNRLTPQTYEQSVRQDLLRDQLVGSLASGAQPPGVAVRHLQRYGQQQRVAEALTLSVDAVAPPPPDQAGLQEYFDERREAYMSPEYRRVTVVVVRPADFLDEVDVSEEELREEYDYRIDEFVTPARRAVDQIVFPDRESADEGRRRLVAGEDFHALGKELFDLSDTDMALGSLAKDEFASPALGAAVFAVAPGETTEPVETPFGWSVARVRDETPGESRDFASVADLLRDERRVALAQDLVVALGDEFEDARAGGATIEEAARAIGVTAATVGPVDRQGRPADHATGGATPPVADFLARAFTAAPNEESPLYDTDDGTYYALRVDTVTPPAEKRLDEVRDAVTSDWQADQRRERTTAQATAIAERLRAGETAAAVAADTGAALHTTEPFRRNVGSAGPELGPAFVAAAFALAPDGVSDPVVEGSRVHVAQIVEVIDIDDENTDARERIAGQLLASQTADIVDSYTAVLYRTHDVKVNQSALERFFDN